jgi:hypothetical protein
MVAAPWDHPWSTCRAYACGAADPLLTEDPRYTELSPDPARRQQLWREFVCGEDPREAAIARGDWAVGEDDFRGRMAQILGRRLPRPRGRPPKGPKLGQVHLLRRQERTVGRISNPAWCGRIGNPAYVSNLPAGVI